MRRLTLSGMLHMLRPVAQQLQSAALRHRHALAVRGREGGPVGHRLAFRPPPTAAAEVTGSFRRDHRMAKVEAVLFLANEPLGSRRIAQFASLADGTEARTLIRRLNRYYDTQNSAFRIEEIAGGFQMLTRPKFGGWLRRLHRSGAESGAPLETRLSAPAMETLTVVAYRQRATRAEIEAVRGVQCGEMLRQLMERDLVRIAGRSNDLGRPFLYATTKRFLQWFGLRHLDELPRAELLRRHEINPVAGRETKLTPSDSTEEHEVSIVANLEPAREELWKLAAAANLTGPQAVAEEDDDVEDDDEEWDDDDDDLDDEEDDEPDDEDDLEDDEWEEVDDEDDDWDEEDDDDWDDEDEDEDEEDDEDDDEEWEDEE
jgi:segregation and condensation protein B